MTYRILLTVLKGSFEIDFAKGERMVELQTLEFEHKVAEAIQCASSLPSHAQVRLEMTTLQLFCRAQKASPNKVLSFG